MTYPTDMGKGGAGRVETPVRVNNRVSAFSTSDLPERIRSKIEVQDDGCWIWTANRLPKGYGQLGWEGATRYSHRVVYELLVGPIPKGLQIDHLCRVRECCNPAHLEPVTCQENLRRGMGGTGVNARKTHCIHGHEFTPENTYHPPKRPHVRGCKSCGLDRQRKSYWKLQTGRGLLTSGAGRGTADLGAEADAIAGGEYRDASALNTPTQEGQF